MFQFQHHRHHVCHGRWSRSGWASKSTKVPIYSHPEAVVFYSGLWSINRYGFMTQGSQLTKSSAPLSCDNTMVNLDALLAHSKRRLYTTYRNTNRNQTSASFFKVTSFGPVISHLFRAEGTSIWRIKRSL